MPFIDCHVHPRSMTSRCSVFRVTDRGAEIRVENVIAVNTMEGWIEVGVTMPGSDRAIMEPNGKPRRLRIYDRFMVRDQVTGNVWPD